MLPVETPYQEMKRYVRFDAEDAQRLAALRPHAQPHFERIAAEFYDRIREHEEAHAVFTGEEQVSRLKRSLVRWMDRVLTGPYDEAYFAETAKIGRVHVRVGLPQRYMFTAMALIRIALTQIAERALGEACGATHTSIHKVLDLELAAMLETFQEDSVERARRVQLLTQQTLADRSDPHLAYVGAVELAHVLIIGIDDQGLVRLFNAEAERVTGLQRDEVFGTPFSRLLPSDLRDEHNAIVLAVAQGAVVPETVDGALRTKSGKVREVHWQLARPPADQPHAVKLYAIGQDVTDQVALSLRMRQNEKLAAVGALAAGLAHEIRNPLNGAQLHVTFLERGLKRLGVEDPDTTEAIRVVADEIRRLSALVSEFLDFARPKPLTLKTTSLAALCQRVLQIGAPDAARAKARLEADMPSSDVKVEVDASKFEQVLINLLQNAFEAVAPLGGGRVILRARREPRFALIEVEDEGPGIPNPESPVFDPFYSTKAQGTGLGLAIVHRIVTDHGGSVEFTSKPGRTIFRVRLPIKLVA